MPTYSGKQISISTIPPLFEQLFLTILQYDKENKWKKERIVAQKPILQNKLK